MVKRVRATISEYQMFDKGERVVAGVSGGPDSVALLFILSSLKDDFDLDLHVAHLDHCLRQEESEGDALFVEDLANRLKLPLVLDRIDLRAEKTKGLSLEAYARQVRYNFFVRVARDVGASKIALGHQADDVVETILIHLIRGSGPGGLSGIPPLRRVSNGIDIVRPLIRIWREEIEGYLKEKGIPSRFDSSNFDTIHLRNRIRNELIPGLAAYNPKFRQALTKSLALWSKDDEYLGRLASEALKTLLLESSEGKVVFVIDNKIQEDPIGFRIIREALTLLKGDLEGITFNHIEGIAHLVKDGPVQGHLDLPHKIKVQREYGRLRLYIDEDGRGVERDLFEYPVSIPGRTRILGLDLDLKILPANGFTLKNLEKISSSTEVYLDYDRVRPPLSVRTRLRGDRFSPLGMGGEKKIKDFYIDLKLPALQRDRIPLLLDRDGIIWVIGFRIDERVKLTDRTKRILKAFYKVDNKDE